MPFTPLHMGPGIVVKAALQGSFSLMVFGWTQILMDLQPLFVMITGEGQLHGFSHTFVGAAIIAIPSALTGKYLSEVVLQFLGINQERTLVIGWPVAFLSSFIGTFSHVLLDSIMHADVQPLFPVTTDNAFLRIITVDALHKLCTYSGLAGGAIYFSIYLWRKNKIPSQMK